MSKKISNDRKRVVVAMSGGVDSSVAAYLLKKQGYDVIGVFLKFWQPPEKVCSAKKDNLCCDMKALIQARQLCGQLKIPFYVFDLSSQFKKDIVDYFISEYKKGRTPNPCIKCNEKVKFGLLWKKAKALGADYLATGHYVGLRPTKVKSSTRQLAGEIPDSSSRILRSKDVKKDQTYFLAGIKPEVLSHLIFPVGGMNKPKVREIAKKAGISVYGKKDSQGICFIPDGETKAFLSAYIKKSDKPGDIVDKEGNVLGKHGGLLGYTIGQREGIGDSISANYIKFRNNKGDVFSDAPRLYVLGLNTKKNQLVVGENRDCFGSELVAEKVTVLDPAIFDLAEKKTLVYAQIRGGAKPEKCRIEIDSSQRGLGKINKTKVVFLQPIRAITPGQGVAFYHRNQLLGGGIIK